MTTRLQSVFTVLLVFAGFSFFLTACQMTGATNGSSVGEPSEQKACEEPDNRARVTGGGECLVIWTYDKSQNLQHPTLVVFLHGDKSRGGPVSWELRFTRNFADPGTVSVALIRPGYPDAFGNRSTGDNYGRRDSYTPHNIDAVAEAIGKLKDHHSATKLVLVGYSGGAAYTGVIIGRHPGLVDAALLIACPCNIHQWRTQRGRRPWKRSRSPHSYARRVPLTTRVIAITGDNDTRTRPSLARKYVETLRKRGVQAEFRLAPRETHNSAPTSSMVFKAVEELAQQTTPKPAGF